MISCPSYATLRERKFDWKRLRLHSLSSNLRRRLCQSAGPADRVVAQCMFLLSFNSPSSPGNKRTIIIVVAVIVCLLALSLVIVGLWLHRRSKKKGKRGFSKTEMGVVMSGLDSMKESTTLIRFTFELDFKCHVETEVRRI
ncbi:hypothetical protein K1719_011242 [Acacia pycnantha]|nr:hypothetical protein K1719_011242 [Acacia pycnantha]